MVEGYKLGWGELLSKEKLIAVRLLRAGQHRERKSEKRRAENLAEQKGGKAK